MGFGADTHNWLVRHTWFKQHSGSSQSTRPSIRKLLKLSSFLYHSRQLLLRTFVIVLIVTTILLKCNSTINTVPSLITTTLPQSFTANTTLAVIRATRWTTFHRTVLSIPTGHAQASAILTLSMLIAPRVTQFRITIFTTPANITLTRFANTTAMLTAVQIAQFWTEKIAEWKRNFRINGTVPFEQSSPLHFDSQLHVCVSRSNVPWPEQSGRHCSASWSIVAQSNPFHPFLHIHAPSAQKPWPEQVGCGQSTKENSMNKNDCREGANEGSGI